MRYPIAICLLLLPLQANAHNWYSGVQNELKQSCCGGQDCAPLADGDVEEVPGGYYIWSKMVFVPQSRAQDSREEDGMYHACFWGTIPNEGERINTPKCFFVPPRGY